MNTANGVCAMNVTISVYSQKAFREFRLPPVRNTTWTICLRRDCFCLENDFLLHLENRDGAWFFGLPDPYCLEYRDRLADLEQPCRPAGIMPCTAGGTIPGSRSLRRPFWSR